MSKIKTHRDRLSLQAGLTMIEILITIVVVSVGLLGLAGLQIAGLKGTSNSALRTQATVLANDIAERMRANLAAVDDNRFFAVTSEVGIDCSTPPAKFCEEHYDGTQMVASAACTPAEMAAYDINIWVCGEVSGSTRVGGVKNLLSNANATIACVDTNPPSGADSDDCTNRSPHRITLNWNERKISDKTNNINETLSMTIQP